MSDPSYAFRADTRLIEASQSNQAHLSCGRLPSHWQGGRMLWVLGAPVLGAGPSSQWPHGEMQGLVDG